MTILTVLKCIVRSVLVNSLLLLCSHHHYPSPELFSSWKTETVPNKEFSVFEWRQKKKNSSFNSAVTRSVWQCNSSWLIKASSCTRCPEKAKGHCVAVLVSLYLGRGVPLRAWWLPVLFSRTGSESLPRDALKALSSGPSLARELVALAGSSCRCDGHMAACVIT